MSDLSDSLVNTNITPNVVPKQLKVLSYNIHKGFSAKNSSYVLKDIRQAIRHAGCDLVFLQEVLGEHSGHARKHTNWINGTQFEYLADTIWNHFAYGRNAIYQQGHHGNAILSKFPFSWWENTDVSRFVFSQRGILHGVIANKVHVFCIHLGLLGIERHVQLKTLIQAVEQRVPNDAPLIIAGDFNDWSLRIDRKIRRALSVQEAFYTAHGRHSRTYPASLPMLPMDRIYFRNLNLVEAHRQLDDRRGNLSDHCAVFAEFSVPNVKLDAKRAYC